MNVLDYLKWRGDIPFSVSPFNYIDNIILTEFPYLNWAGIITDRPITLEEAVAKYEPATFDSTLKTRRQETVIRACKCERFKHVKAFRYVKDFSAEQEKQFCAMSFKLPDRTYYISYCGTDSTITGWKENFNMTYMMPVPAQEEAASYLKKIVSRKLGMFRVGGHSKGGNFAIYAASFISSEVQDRILTVFSNDGPGFRKEVIEMPGYLRILPKVVRIIPDTSMIGMLLSNKAEYKVIRSNASGILQHDVMSWSTERARFEPAELSDLGKLLNTVLDSWIDDMNDELRNSGTDTIFAVFEATGADSFREISHQKLKSAEAMLAYLLTIPKEKQGELFHLAGNLLKNGSQIALAQLQEQLFTKTENRAEQKESDTSRDA